jgi:hypothetical protein
MAYRIRPYTYSQARKHGVVVKPSTVEGKKIDVFNKKGEKLASIGAIGYGDFPNYFGNMFSSGGYIMILGILMGLAFIVSSVYFVNKIFVKQTKDVLVKFVILIFTALVGLFIVDKVIAFKIKLLPDDQNAQLFDLIKTLVLMIFSYYFGTKTVDKKNE